MIRCPTPEVGSYLKNVAVSQILDLLACEVARVQGQPACKKKKRDDVSSDVSGHGGSWTTTPPSAHADRSFDVSRRRVEKVAAGARSCENQRSGTVLKCVKKNVLPLGENVEIDGTLVAYSRNCFAQGIPHHHGLQLLSAEMDRWPVFSRSCSSKLQRFHRCLKGW